MPSLFSKLETSSFNVESSERNVEFIYRVYRVKIRTNISELRQPFVEAENRGTFAALRE